MDIPFMIANILFSMGKMVSQRNVIKYVSSPNSHIWTGEKSAGQNDTENTSNKERRITVSIIKIC